MSGVRIAVDCGGTSSKALLLADGEPSARQRFTSEATLSGYLEPRLIGTTMRQILAPIDAAYREAGLSGSAATIVISAAGFIDSLRETYRAAAEAVIADLFDGATTAVVVVNDGAALLLGHEADAAVIAGTGSTVLVRGETISQHGGHDWVASDDGSGFWVGLEGIRSVASDIEAGVESSLTTLFYRAYDIPNGEAEATFRSLAIAGARMKADIAHFAVSVCDAAEQGDQKAREILDRQADALASLFDRGVRQGRLPTEIRVVECGGLMGNLFYRSLFEGRITDRIADLGHRCEWILVPDGLAAASEMAAGPLSWGDGFGARLPLVVAAGDRTG